jgi:hypothetical protein
MRALLVRAAAVLVSGLLAAGTVAVTAEPAHAAAAHEAGSSAERCKVLQVKLIRSGHITGASKCIYRDTLAGRWWWVVH